MHFSKRILYWYSNIFWKYFTKADYLATTCRATQR